MSDLTPEEREALLDALYRVEAGYAGADAFRRTVVDDDLAPVVARMIAEAEQRGREDNADHGMCYVSSSKALEARDEEMRRQGRGGLA